MTKNKTFLFSFLLIFAVLCCAGCKDKMGGTYHMTVKVTLDGKPLEGATVMLIESASEKTAVGMTDASGVAKVKSTEGWEGVFPGEYGVAITKIENTISDTPPKGVEVDPNFADDEESGGYAVSRELLPKKYGSATTSGLELKQESKKGHFEFDITEKP